MNTFGIDGGQVKTVSCKYVLDFKPFTKIAIHCKPPRSESYADTHITLGKRCLSQGWFYRD